MTDNIFPARLHILVARSSKQAIVIRKGPSKYTCVVGWNRGQNTFQVSQWLKGRIYERRSDISPSGSHWIYFATKAKWGTESINTWTAIARSPWLKAVSMYSKGDAWHGGGLFLKNKTYWLNEGGILHEEMHLSSEIKRNKNYQPKEQYGGECLHVYYNRLQRDGWILKENFRKEKWDKGTIFEKELAYKWILRKVCHAQVNSPEGKSCYWDEHLLLSKRGEKTLCSDWEWAEWVDNTIYYAEKGSLYSLLIENSKQVSSPKLLHDFNSYKFENKKAPY